MSQSFNKAWNKVASKDCAVVSRPLTGALPATTFHVIRRPGTKLAISLSDQHVPFQDKKVEKQTLAMLAACDPDVVVLNGDVVDFYSISNFLKDPSRALTLQSELDATVEYLRKVKLAAPRAAIHYTIGNHEARLVRYLRSNAKAIAELRCMQFENLIEAGDLDINIHGTEGYRLNRSLIVTHGARISKHAGATARMEFERHLMSGVSGHTHRVGRYDVTGVSGDYSWVEQGCLCDLNPEYIAGKPNWQQGYAIIEYSAHRFHVREERIVGRKLILDGRDFS